MSSTKNPTSFSGGSVKKETKPILIVLLIILLLDFTIIGSLFVFGNSLDDFAVHSKEIKDVSENLWSDKADHSPLYGWIIFVFNKITFGLIGFPVNAMIVSIIFQLLTAVVIFNINKVLEFSTRKSAIITLLIMLFPIQIIFTTIHPRLDSTVTFFIASAFYFYLKKKENLMIFSLILSALTHYITSVFGLFLFLYYILKKEYKKLWKSFLILIPFIGLILVRYIITGELFHFINVHNEYVAGSIIVFPFYGLVQTMNKGVVGYLLSLYLIPFFALSIFGIYYLYKKRNYNILIFVLPLFLFNICLHGTALYYDFPRFALHFNFPILIYPLSLVVDNWKDYKVKFLFFIFLMISIVTLTYLVMSFPSTNITEFAQTIKGVL